MKVEQVLVELTGDRIAWKGDERRGDRVVPIATGLAPLNWLSHISHVGSPFSSRCLPLERSGRKALGNAALEHDHHYDCWDDDDQAECGFRTP